MGKNEGGVGFLLKWVPWMRTAHGEAVVTRREKKQRRNLANDDAMTMRVLRREVNNDRQRGHSTPLVCQQERYRL